MCISLLPFLVAHSPNQDEIWHSLESHLVAVAEQAEIFASKLKAGILGYYAGLWHDTGKSASDFQRYLNLCAQASQFNQKPPTRGPDHKTAGALLASQQKLDPLSFLIFGHHGGLPDSTDLKAKLLEATSEERIQKSIELTAQSIEGFLPEKPSHQLQQHAALKSRLSAELFIRLLFSTLVDADFLDTERHFKQNQSDLRSQNMNLEELWHKFHNNQKQLMQQAEGPVNQIRREIYEACLDSAEQPPGMFRLTVPTGGGKTRASLGFALKHALKHNLDRVIVVIPYTSIIEQTADEYRKILGPDAIIEHHSSVQFAEDPDNPTEAEIRARLATENWDAPVIVTTSVQFFESLFSNKPSKCRKLHNITRSVVILDEVQTLPGSLLAPICDVLQQLIRYFSTSLVLCTATQPAWESSPWLTQATIPELVPQPERYFTALKRVNFQFQHQRTWDWQEVADAMTQYKQVLCIVNTKKDALDLLALLPDDDVLHLSTLLCGANRRDVLAEVKHRLKQQETCYLVATQVVEAGVDLDFPVVMRAMGPLDRIVQAAGRCNREGKLGQHGEVIVFQPTEARMPPGEYRNATDTAHSILAEQQWDLNQPAVFQTYFQRLYQSIDSSMGESIQKSRQSLEFASVAEQFKLIKDDSVSLIVRYTAGEHIKIVDQLLSELNTQWGSTKAILRRLQPYMVNVRRFYISEYQRQGLIRELMPGLYEWLGQYDNLTGLISKTIAPEDLVL